jgi:hypothetical protein
MKPSFANIRDVLHICGPLTMREVAQFFPDVHYRQVSSFLTAMRLTVVTKQIHIQSWTMEGFGRRYPRPVYALGNKPDARKPPPMNNAERQRRARARLKPPVGVVNSVFAWRPSA